MIPPYESHGAGPVLIMLHAFPLSRKMWEPIASDITAAGWRSILPDHRGFGEYNSFADINTMADMAADVISLIEEIGAEKVVLGGLSMGGYVSFEVMRQRPDLVRALILCDTTAAADTPEKQRSRYELAGALEDSGVQPLIDKTLPTLISDAALRDNTELTENIKGIILNVNPQGAAAALRGMAQRADSTDLLDSISIPVQLIIGEEDKITGVPAAEKMHERLPDSRLAIIPCAGHLSSLERPQEFAAVVTAFLRELS